MDEKPHIHIAGLLEMLAAVLEKILSIFILKQIPIKCDLLL